MPVRVRVFPLIAGFATHTGDGLVRRLHQSDSCAVTRFVAAGAGFLLAVLWFDLMHDVQVLRRPAGDLPSTVLDSVAAYYRRVTTDARPMNRLVAAVMLATLASIAVQAVHRGDAPSWLPWTALVLSGSAVLLAAVHTVPAAVRLGARRGSAAEQSRLARGVCRDHLLCFAAMSTMLALELGFGG